ncbi:MAG: PepSY-like domain-containing protein [Gemmata sp.]
MVRPVPALVLALGLYATCARAEEKEVPLDKVPAKAMSAVQKQFPNAKLVEAWIDVDGDVVEYYVALQHNKSAYEVTVTEDGKILEVARETGFHELPKAVAAAFRNRHPKAKVDGVWELTTPGVKGKTYQIDFTTANGKELAAEFDPAGKLLSEDGGD